MYYVINVRARTLYIIYEVYTLVYYIRARNELLNYITPLESILLLASSIIITSPYSTKVLASMRV